MSVFDEGAHIELRVGNNDRGLKQGKPSRLMPKWFHKKHYEPTYSEFLRYFLHPFKRGFLGLARNKYGTPISVHRCSACGVRFSVCHAEPDFGDCQADTCSSYDPNSDVSFLMGWDSK
jgi:hypothetical protein